MILKKLKRGNLQKTKAAMIGGLVDYVLALKDEEGRAKRLYAYGMNFLTTKTAAWKREMIALSEESVRSKMPVTHWAMSWQENEIPNRQQVEEAVNIFMERMGLRGHQAIVAAHGNTANFHIHIVVNRTHPYTEKVVQPHRGFDIEAAHKIVAEIEHKQGWASQAHARYRVNEQGEIVRNRLPEWVKPRPRAEDFESATGEKSAQRLAQEKGHAIIKNAQSWEELHGELEAAGLRFVRKGSGAVIFVGDTAIKASSVDRNFSLSKLCKRLGAFQPGYYGPQAFQKPKPEPVSHVCHDQWREYQKKREQEAEERRAAQQRSMEAWERFREQQQERREAACSALAGHGLAVLNIARHCLQLQEQEENRRARERMKEVPRPKPLPRFKQWLGEQSPRLAHLWRLRRRIRPNMEVGEFVFPKTGTLAEPFTAYQEMVKRRFSDVKLARSRLDYMTALYLRCAGYSSAEVSTEMARHTPAPANAREQRLRAFYEQRLVGHAFGTAGDIDIATIRPTQEQIMKFNREAEMLVLQEEMPHKKHSSMRLR